MSRNTFRISIEDTQGIYKVLNWKKSTTFNGFNLYLVE